MTMVSPDIALTKTRSRSPGTSNGLRNVHAVNLSKALSTCELSSVSSVCKPWRSVRAPHRLLPGVFETRCCSWESHPSSTFQAPNITRPKGD